MSSVTGHAVHLERPERSRNAKAQARHRAKRKAYIEQLEQTVTKLQMSLGLSHDDVSVLPPPLIRIRELEQENGRLLKDNEELRRMLADTGRSPETLRRNLQPTYPDNSARVHDSRANDYKRKKYGGESDGGYMSPGDTPPQIHEPIRPPPLTIPQSMTHHYPYTSSNQHALSGSSSLFSLHASPAFQMPNTPSGSSATSSPPFSPAQMQEPLHSPVEHRPSPMTGTQNMTNYSSRTGHYSQVKVEEDSYVTQHGHYSLPPPTESYSHNGANNNGMDGNTLDFETLGIHDLHGTMISPGSIVDTLGEEAVFYHIWAAVKQTLDERASRRIPNDSLVKASLERFLYEIADVILCRVDGPHFTFVDPRKHRDTYSMVRNAQRLIALFGEKDIPKGKIVVNIPATIEGLMAAQELENKHRIHTNLYLVSSFLHAAACAEAGATTITVPVGRLLQWYERKRKATFGDLSTHPGIEAIQSYLEYFKLHGIKTKVMGSGFRSLSEIASLTGLDAICISKDQADGFTGCQIGISTSSTGPSPPAQLRARQAQYPTNLLSSHSGLMDAMSPETRAMVTSMLYSSLGEMKCQMDKLEAIVEKEVIRQFKLKTLDLKTLYHALEKQPYKYKGSRGEAPGGQEIKKLRTKRTQASDLGIEENSSAGHDIDDVF
ncbi:hypothetical protein H0H87_012802 [Tephrocybe sp. NHM501043]|nr:hypothetical protein H0H87_012802 [Tephrocybe sp. NHM501043]